jgi:hypothetical protein
VYVFTLATQRGSSRGTFKELKAGLDLIKVVVKLNVTELVRECRPEAVLDIPKVGGYTNARLTIEVEVRNALDIVPDTR